MLRSFLTWLLKVESLTQIYRVWTVSAKIRIIGPVLRFKKFDCRKTKEYHGLYPLIFRLD